MKYSTITLANRSLVLLALIFCIGIQSYADNQPGWADRMSSLFRKSAADGPVDLGAFANTDELTRALKQALGESAERALRQLAQAGGFADSDEYRIPLPQAVENFRRPLELIRQDYRLDNLQATMNAAAEQGVSAAPAIVGKAIEDLKMEDLTKLWKGGDDAITRFLEQRSRAQLAEEMLPLIANATESSGATSAYRSFVDAIPQGGGSLLSRLRGAPQVASIANFDLNEYINQQALDSLFSAMAAQEKSLRENPMARGSELVRKLFGN